MRLLSRVTRLLRNITHKGKVERELSEEVSSYIDLLTRAKMEAGLNESEAQRAALMQAGGSEQLKEQIREVRIGYLVETVVNDVRFGVRSLWKTPAFTAVAVLVLGLGIGANTAMYSVVKGVLLQSLPYAEPDRLVILSEHHVASADKKIGVSPANYRDWLEQNSCFEEMAILSDGGRANVTGGGDPEEIQAQIVTPSFFAVLGVQPLLGRVFAEDEGRRGRNKVVVLSHSFWQARFGGAANILGQSVTLNRENYEIIGVMPPAFRFLESEARLWVPTTIDPSADYRASSGRFMQSFARLKAGVSIDQAQAEMSQLAKRLEAKHPEFNSGWSVRVLPLQEALVRDLRLILLVLLAATAFVLLIACANVANLLLSRAAARKQELAIRAALGAGRTRLVRQLLTESVLLALMGGLLGVLLAYWGLELVTTFGEAVVPRLSGIAIDRRVLAFTVAISLLTGLLFGLLPSLQASRAELNDALKRGAHGSARTRGGTMRNALLVSEVSLALVLLIGAGLMIRSFMRLQSVESGFDPARVLTLQFGLAGDNYKEPHQILGFFREAEERIAALPGVVNVGAINYLPLTGPASATNVKFVARPAAAPGETPNTAVRVITPTYFGAMGIPLLKGRMLDERDGRDSRVLVINETFAKTYFPNEEPLGKQIIVNWETDEPDEIVGVVGDVRETSLDQQASPAVYWPHGRVPYAKMALIIRASRDPVSLASAAQKQVRSMEPDQPIHVRTMEQVIAKSIARPRFNTLLLAIFAGVALVLASVGLYGVMNYSATQRTHEVGIRMALGATRADIMRLVVGNGMLLTLIGIGIGVLASIGLTRVMQRFLFGVGATDAVTFIGVSALLIVVALVANYIPARRATRVNPVIALRYE